VGNITQIFGGPLVRSRSHELPADQQIMEAMEATGFEAPDHIDIDGGLHRFSTNGKSGDKAGWYIMYPGPVVAGAFGDWRTGSQKTFIQDTGRELTMIESVENQKRVAEAKEKYLKERDSLKKVKGEALEDLYAGFIDATEDHPYLKDKGIQPHGAKVTGDGRLVLPLYTKDGNIQALQYINRDGKRFENSYAECFHMLGPQDSETAFITEGFADAATVVEETGLACYIAYSKHNLTKVAPIIKGLGLHKKLIIVADNDESGDGQRAAYEAGNLINSKVIVPPRLGDINDYRLAGESVSDLLMPSVLQPQDWLISADDFCKRPDPIKWLVKGWVQRNALHMVHGPSGGGKTFFVLDLVASIAIGKDWQGTKTRKGKVVYLAGEGHHGLKSRLAGWSQHHKSKLNNLWVSKSGCDLNTPDGYSKVVDSLRQAEIKPDVIVVDTLHRFLSGDENSALDAKTMLDACAGLMMEFGCSVILVHHTGVGEKAQDRGRGSSAWRGALDIEINVKPGDEDKDEPITVSQLKSKDAELAKPRPFELISIPVNGWIDEDGEQVTTAILKASAKDVPKEKASKTNSKINALTNRLYKAWKHGVSARNDNQQPVISREELKAYLSEVEGKTQSNIKQELAPNKEERMVGCLIKNGIIEKDDELFIVVDGTTLSIFSVFEQSQK